MKKEKFLIPGPFTFLMAFLICIIWLPKSDALGKVKATGKFNKNTQKKELPEKKKIVFIAGACSHGPGEHEHYAGCTLLAAELNKQMGALADAVVFQSWPADTTILDEAASVVMYMDGAENHLALQHLQHLNTLMKKGVGLVCLHYAVEVPKEKGGSEFKDWIGGYFETFWSVNPHWKADYKRLPKHPVTNGVEPFAINDEWYYHMRFRDNMKGVTPILTAVPPASTLSKKDGPRDNNEFVRKEQGQPQIMCWVNERSDGGRGFGFTGGHFHKNWGNENFRKVVLNGIVWSAKMTVPKNGVPTPALSDAVLQQNLDQKPCPANR